MITFLKGNLTDALPTQVVIDVNGIGYEVLIPLSSFEKLPELGQAVTLKTQLVVREDSQTLYGFATNDERELFRMIQGVSGIGPRLALNVLSGMDVASFKGAIGAGDVKRLSSISGVGKKTAERMVLELKDKLGVAPGGAAAPLGQALAGKCTARATEAANSSVYQGPSCSRASTPLPPLPLASCFRIWFMVVSSLAPQAAKSVADTARQSPTQ